MALMAEDGLAVPPALDSLPGRHHLDRAAVLLQLRPDAVLRRDRGARPHGRASQKLVPRALWWFRWGAMITFITGWLYLLMRAHH